MTTKSWSDLYPKGAEETADIGRVDFVAAREGQSVYVIAGLAKDVDKINAMPRTEKNDRDDFVTALGDTGVNYYASPGVTMAIEGDELVFTPESFGGGDIYFSSGDEGEGTIYGVRVRSSGYFQLFSPTGIKGQFTAVELIDGVNTMFLDDGTVYPPGAYIFDLDGSEGIGFNMKQSYSDSITLTQPPGKRKIQIELVATPKPDLVQVWYAKDGTRIAATDPNIPLGTREQLYGYTDQRFLTEVALQDILSNVFASADTDPTGDGVAYLPWKLEQWYTQGNSNEPYDLSTAAVDVVNKAARTTSRYGIPNYAGVLIKSKSGLTQGQDIDYYSDPSVQIAAVNDAEGAPMLRVALDIRKPADRSFILSTPSLQKGLREVSISTSGHFRIKFFVLNSLDEVLSHRAISAIDPSNGDGVVLDENTYSYVDGVGIYPPGSYLFRSQDDAGVQITLLARGVTRNSVMGAYLAITRLSAGAGREFYNVWFEDRAGQPVKIVNSTDPQDQPVSLHGMTQITPVLRDEMEKIGIQAANAMWYPRIWKVEEWAGYQYQPRPFTGSVGADPSVPPTLGDGLTVDLDGPEKPSFSLADGVLTFIDAFTKPEEKFLILYQTQEPFVHRTTIQSSIRWTLKLIEPGTDKTRLQPSTDDTVHIMQVGKNTLLPSDAVDYPAGVFNIFLNGNSGLMIGYGRISTGKPAARVVTQKIILSAPETVSGKVALYSVIQNLRGEVVTVANMEDNTDIRPNTAGLFRVPTLAEASIEVDDPDAIPDPAELIAELKAEIEALKKAAADGATQPIWKIDQRVAISQKTGKAAVYAVVYGADGKVISIANSADNTDTIKIPPDGSLPDDLLPLTTLAEEKLRLDPEIKPNDLSDEMREIFDYIDAADRSVGIQDAGKSSDFGGNVKIDWSTGKIMKHFEIDADTTLDFIDPTPAQGKLELYLYLTSSLPKKQGKKITLVPSLYDRFVGLNPKTANVNGGWVLKDTATAGDSILFHMFWDGIKYNEFSNT